MDNITIRATVAADIPALTRILDETGLFPSEMLEGLLTPSLTGDSTALWRTGLIDGTAVGLCFATPEDLADRVWNMLALGVLPRCQGQGVGGRIVHQLEADLRAMGQRMLIVDTSGTEAFSRARTFYEQLGYDRAACILDYWSDGDDKVTYRKRLG